MTTKAQLQAEVEALRHNLNLREVEVAQLKQQLADITNPVVRNVRLRPVPYSRVKYEFDPAIPGDFARASTLARVNNGTVVRKLGA